MDRIDIEVRIPKTTIIVGRLGYDAKRHLYTESVDMHALALYGGEVVGEAFNLAKQSHRDALDRMMRKPEP